MKIDWDVPIRMDDASRGPVLPCRPVRCVTFALAACLTGSAAALKRFLRFLPALPSASLRARCRPVRPETTSVPSLAISRPGLIGAAIENYGVLSEFCTSI